jgi:DNA-directed RNA polymerase specialized sigma24 family protein
LTCTGADGAPSVEDVVLRADGRRAVRRGLAELSAEQRRLLLLLVAEPALTYRQISQRLGIPIGSVGPTRSRCLRRLANTPSVRALLA